MKPYGFEKGAVPAPYRALDWTERLERTNRDYGVPEGYPVPSSYVFLDLERNADYMLGLTYF